MALFIRFTENIRKDIEVGTSILTNHDNMIVDGLCAFGPYKSREEAQKCVNFWQKMYPAEHEHYALVKADEVLFSKKGSLGTIIRNIEVIEIH